MTLAERGGSLLALPPPGSLAPSGVQVEVGWRARAGMGSCWGGGQRMDRSCVGCKWMGAV